MTYYNNPDNKAAIDKFVEEAEGLLSRIDDFASQNHHPALLRCRHPAQELIEVLKEIAYAATPEGQARAIREFEDGPFSGSQKRSETRHST